MWGQKIVVLNSLVKKKIGVKKNLVLKYFIQKMWSKKFEAEKKLV